jgi:hypothetical protein
MSGMEAARAPLRLLYHRAQEGIRRWCTDRRRAGERQRLQTEVGDEWGWPGLGVVVGWAGMEEFQRKMSWAAKVN